MARRGSNRDRIGRMREEAAATERERKEKAEQRARAASVPGAPKRASKKPVGDGRMKMVWAVKDGRGEIVNTYPYPRKEDALVEARRLTDAGKAHIVTPHKVSFYEE
ncbi:MAG: hypothetical protein ACYTGN_06000 [Planctomycetota bacterium]|jgi:hypothetical protein